MTASGGGPGTGVSSIRKEQPGVGVASGSSVDSTEEKEGNHLWVHKLLREVWGVYTSVVILDKAIIASLPLKSNLLNQLCYNTRGREVLHTKVREK